MFVLEINYDKCNACGICIEICPEQKFNLNENNKPEINKNNCIFCYNCVSMCPETAVNSTVKRFTPYISNNLPEKKAIDFINSKRTAVLFDETSVDKATLDEILLNVKYAPSFENRHKLYFTVIENTAVEKLLFGIKSFFKKLIQLTENKIYRFMLKVLSSKKNKYYYSEEFLTKIKLMLANNNKDVFFKNAPALVLIHSNYNSPFISEEAFITAERICFLAHAHGLQGAINVFAPAGINKNYKLKNAMGFDKHENVFACVLLGYEKYPRNLDVYRESPIVEHF